MRGCPSPVFLRDLHNSCRVLPTLPYHLPPQLPASHDKQVDVIESGI